MKITIESTDTLVTLVVNGAEVPARMWQGETSSGIPIHCFVTRVAVKEGLPDATYKQFETELQEQAKPRFELQAIPLRLIL
jgi:hypothetical protein